MKKRGGTESGDNYGFFCGTMSDDALSDKAFPDLSPIRPLKFPPTEAPFSPQLSDNEDENDTSAMDTSFKSFASEDSEYELFKSDFENKRIKSRIDGITTFFIILVFSIVLTYIDYRMDHRLQIFMARCFSTADFFSTK